MAFTTWSALYTQMLDDMTSGSWRTASYSIGGRTRTYKTFAEFKEALEYVKGMADIDGGDQVARTYPRPRGSAS